MRLHSPFFIVCYVEKQKVNLCKINKASSSFSKKPYFVKSGKKVNLIYKSLKSIKKILVKTQNKVNGIYKCLFEKSKNQNVVNNSLHFQKSCHFRALNFTVYDYMYAFFIY